MQNLVRVNDIFFKYLMGDSKKKNITLAFLNDILDRTGENQFTDIVFRDKELVPEAADGKLSILDIQAVMNDGSLINIEVQVCRDAFMTNRSLYYWARMYGGQLQYGEQYDQLAQAITINLLDFDAFSAYATCHHVYEIRSREDGALLPGLEMHFLELEKITLSDIRNLKKSERWIAYFSKKCTDEERRELAMTMPAIKEAMKYEDYFTKDDAMRRQYELREKAVKDYNTAVSVVGKREYAKGEEKGLAKGEEIGLAKGRAEGKEIGRAEGKEIGRVEGKEIGRAEGKEIGRDEEKLADIQKGLQKGMDIDTIAFMTDYTAEEVQDIIQKL